MLTWAYILFWSLVGFHAQSAASEAFPSFPEFNCEPAAPFCNLAEAAGLDEARRYGRGAAFADIDGDGWDDLFLADSDNRWDESYGVSMFFLNRRDGSFRPVPAEELGIDKADLVATWNGSFADADNDGDPDLLLANGGYSGRSNLAFYDNRLNAEEERFVRVTDSSGLAVANDQPWNWWGSSWADYDRDGALDVVVTRTDGRAMLFHNRGDGTFEEVGGDLGVGIDMQDGKNPVWLDHDSDGDPDLYLAGMWEHAFYRNDGGVFVDITRDVFRTPLPLPATWTGPPAPAVFVAAAADFDQDGSEDLYLGRFDLQDMLFLNDGSGRFEPHGPDWGLTASDAPWSDYARPFENTMGLGVGDLFDDGYPDLFIGTGNPARAAPDIVLCNTADGSFDRCTEQVLGGADRTWRTHGHAAVFADYDQDGDTDMAVNLGGHPSFDAEAGAGRISPEWPALIVNRAGPRYQTATLTLEGTTSNRDAVGARLRVEGSDVHYYTVRSMQGFQAQNSRSLIVSLGTATTGDVEIRWPSGQTQSIEIEAGERMTVIEP